MKESAHTALSVVRNRSEELGIDAGFYRETDIHLHVPAGAIPKDGPSAGVAMAISLASLLAGRPVRSDVAMTGEITLRGRILPVGGIKEKVLAAHRAGITGILLPARNEKDLQEIPEEIRKKMTFTFVDSIDEAWSMALAAGKSRRKPRKKKPASRKTVRARGGRSRGSAAASGRA
jgi:ATP-dependent Lon protease